MDLMKKISIIIPAYNEAPTIRQLVERILEVPFGIDYEIVIVDDHSQDQTHEIADALGRENLGKIKILHNDVNRGKGYSIQKGFLQASGDVVVVQDADFEYDPNEIPRLLKPILEGSAEVVYGSRFLGKGKPNGMAFPNYVANRFLTWLTNCLYGCKLTDMETCYKLVKRDVLASLNLTARRFDFEPEITSKLTLRGISILEMPISYQGRTAAEGKKIKARDFFMAIEVLFKNRW
jgi:glycosyltransferase involved in cell wall biosynthesis